MTLTTDLTCDLGHEFPRSNLEIAIFWNIWLIVKDKTCEYFGRVNVLFVNNFRSTFCFHHMKPPHMEPPPGGCCLAAQEWPLPKCSFFCPLWLTKLLEIGQGCSWTWSDLSDNGVWSNDGLLRRNSGNVTLELLVSCYIIVPDCPGIVHRPASAYWPSHSELAVFIYLDIGVYSTE